MPNKMLGPGVMVNTKDAATKASQVSSVMGVPVGVKVADSLLETGASHKGDWSIVALFNGAIYRSILQKLQA
ncbi:hypothetical protein GCM10022277_44600 [Litoribacillus peritrichatus]|uniref:Uncharacterized protein n=1 Tax=Litoribacillus peritrichatus TaxID=718191 RepID=A0ABP7NDT6_9GAMM